jgi:hypothetical protein
MPSYFYTVIKPALAMSPEHMNEVDLSLVKAGFAVSEVVIPHPDKTFVVSQRSNLFDLLMETLSPAAEGLGIVRSVIVEFHQPHVG